MKAYRLVVPVREKRHQAVIGKYVKRMKGGLFPTCERTGKVIYESHVKAVHCSDELMTLGCEIQYAYLCKSCGGYHLTREPQ